MSHADVVAAIVAGGGRLAASFELDEDGETIGARRQGNRRAHCSGCGETGHVLSRCNGPGNPPRPTHRERRLAEATARRETPEWREALKERMSRRGPRRTR